MTVRGLHRLWLWQRGTWFMVFFSAGGHGSGSLILPSAQAKLENNHHHCPALAKFNSFFATNPLPLCLRDHQQACLLSSSRPFLASHWISSLTI